MSDAKTPPEPSIDEILATIRRIISDDEQAGTAGAVGGAAPKPVETKTAGTKTADDNDVLELTEALNEDGTTRHLAPIGGRSSRRPAAIETPPAAPRADPQLRLRTSSSSEPEPPRRDAPSLRLAPAQPAAGQPTGGQPTGGQPDGGQPAGGQSEPRLSRELPVGGGERTLEDIVRDTLRPLLQAWLDENLQPIVERLVQAEITRVAREAAGRG
jgi:hypothetical protein